jgi:hypothetical protein
VASAVTVLRAYGSAHVVLGTALSSRPNEVARVVAGREASPPSWVVRMLGVRLLAQGVAELVRPTCRVLLCAAGIDALHAASMIGVAADTRYRRCAIVSAAVAGTSAGLTVWTVLRLRRRANLS